MPRIFISYRRDDTKVFSARIHDRLRKDFGKNGVFFDVDNHIPAGSTWRQILQNSLSQSDVLLVIIGDQWETIINQLKDTDDWVRFEVEHGLKRNDMLLIPVLIDDTKVPAELPDSIRDLTENQIFNLRHDPYFDAGMQQLSKEIRDWRRKRNRRLPFYPLVAVTTVLVIFVLLFAQFTGIIPGNDPADEETDSIAENIESPTFTDNPTATTPPPTDTATSTASNTPDLTATANAIALTDLFATSDALTETQAWIDSWTDTPTPTATNTPDLTATANAIALTDFFATSDALTQTRAWIDSWTDTPTPTASSTATETPSPTNTLDPLSAAIERASNFEGTMNSDWIPYSYRFTDGHEMVLVPAGCFEMGSTEEQLSYVIELCEAAAGVNACQNVPFEREQPSHPLCFDTAFWIDRYEITNVEYGSTGSFEEPLLPRESVTWDEANTFCRGRNGRLPSEAEWEYAARGVESWIYPWGNEFDAAYTTFNRTAGDMPVVVSANVNGQSWVGALNMSGNVWEWTNSRFFDYPYDATDGRENSEEDFRVLRGGSYKDGNSIVRPGYRGRALQDYQDESTGFRCVLPLSAR